MDNGEVMDRMNYGPEYVFRRRVLELAIELAAADARGGQLVARDLTDSDVGKYTDVAIKMMHAAAKHDAFS